MLGQITGALLVDNATNLNAATNYSFVAVYNGTDLRMYINGALDSTPIAGTGSMSNVGVPVLIGISPHATPAGFGGIIDDVRIWGRASPPPMPVSITVIRGDVPWPLRRGDAPLSIKLLLIIVCVLLGRHADAATRLGLFHTQQEVAIWTQRAVSGAYRVAGDASTNSPGDWTRIVANRNTFAASPSNGRWLAPVTGAGGCVFANTSTYGWPEAATEGGSGVPVSRPCATPPFTTW